METCRSLVIKNLYAAEKVGSHTALPGKKGVPSFLHHHQFIFLQFLQNFFSRALYHHPLVHYYTDGFNPRHSTL